MTPIQTRRLWAACCMIVLCAGLFSCAVETDIPKDVHLSCVEEGDCPGGWTCDVDKGVCLAPGVLPEDGDDTGDDDDDDSGETDGDGSWEDAYRAEDKEAICQAMYTKSVECQRDLETRLPALATLLEAGEESFVHDTCILVILGSSSDDDLDELMTTKDLIPLASCSMFVDNICSMAAESEDLPTCVES